MLTPSLILIDSPSTGKNFLAPVEFEYPVIDSIPCVTGLLNLSCRSTLNIGEILLIVIVAGTIRNVKWSVFVGLIKIVAPIVTVPQ